MTEFFYINSDMGHIGHFWWTNSNNVDRLWMGNVSPWVKKWCIRWGTSCAPTPPA